MLPELIADFDKTVALFGIPFVPAGLEAFAKPRAKNVKNSFSLQVPPFSPHICHLFRWAFRSSLTPSWNDIHIVRDDRVLRVLPVSDLQYTFLSLPSLRLVVEDVNAVAKQVQASPITRAKKVAMSGMVEW